MKSGASWSVTAIFGRFESSRDTRRVAERFQWEPRCGSKFLSPKAAGALKSEIGGEGRNRTESSIQIANKIANLLEYAKSIWLNSPLFFTTGHQFHWHFH
jgi:hypothetical protein